jgi:hypothetical protein
MRWGLPLEIPGRTLQELPAIARTAEEGGYTDGWPGGGRLSVCAIAAAGRSSRRLPRVGEAD